MDNIARHAAAESPDWIIIGLRYFNVYGPRESAQRGAREHGLSFSKTDEGGPEATHFQTRRAKSAISFT